MGSFLGPWDVGDGVVSAAGSVSPPLWVMRDEMEVEFGIEAVPNVEEGVIKGEMAVLEGGEGFEVVVSDLE